jgi:hypothetical protein
MLSRNRHRCTTQRKVCYLSEAFLMKAVAGPAQCIAFDHACCAISAIMIWCGSMDAQKELGVMAPRCTRNSGLFPSCVARNANYTSNRQAIGFKIRLASKVYMSS